MTSPGARPVVGETREVGTQARPIWPHTAAAGEKDRRCFLSAVSSHHHCAEAYHAAGQSLPHVWAPIAYNEAAACLSHAEKAGWPPLAGVEAKFS